MSNKWQAMQNNIKNLLSNAFKFNLSLHFIISFDCIAKKRKDEKSGKEYFNLIERNANTEYLLEMTFSMLNQRRKKKNSFSFALLCNSC